MSTRLGLAEQTKVANHLSSSRAKRSGVRRRSVGADIRGPGIERLREVSMWEVSPDSTRFRGARDDGQLAVLESVSANGTDELYALDWEAP